MQKFLYDNEKRQKRWNLSFVYLQSVFFDKKKIKKYCWKWSVTANEKLEKIVWDREKLEKQKSKLKEIIRNKIMYAMIGWKD